VRLAGNLAWENRVLRLFQVGLEAVPELASRLRVRGVPALLAGRVRHDGPLAEWVMAQLLETAARGDQNPSP
jgi:hypothetical protein